MSPFSLSLSPPPSLCCCISISQHHYYHMCHVMYYHRIAAHDNMPPSMSVNQSNQPHYQFHISIYLISYPCVCVMVFGIFLTSSTISINNNNTIYWLIVVHLYSINSSICVSSSIAYTFSLLCWPCLYIHHNLSN
jgi:hypothetical protein